MIRRTARHALTPLAIVAATLVLSACGGGGTDGATVAPGDQPRGTALTPNPDRVVRLSVAEFKALLEVDDKGKTLETVAGEPKCGIDLRYLQYKTVGGQGEPTNATAAIMIPAGTDPGCNGPRPMVLYGHGTATEKGYNIANLTDVNQPAAAEGVVVAAMFAAQGYIVVAPNYAGYDKSTLPYHPFLNADQQGKDMVDALTAARSTLPALQAVDSGKLFVTGYSQGGFAALAAHRELQATGQNLTASAPLSAPSAISLLIDYTPQGSPLLGSTVFLPMITTSWQKQFGNVYANTTDIYEAQYAAGIDTLIPTAMTTDELFSTGKLPKLALFPANATPGPINATAALSYGAGNLVTQAYLTTWAGDVKSSPCPGNTLPATTASQNSPLPLDCKPANGLRKGAVANDLRNWVPQRPVLMCGGANDPTVNFQSTLATAGYFRARGMPATALTVVDLEASGTSDAYSGARAGFAQAKAQERADTEGTEADKDLSVTMAYHGQLAPAYCMQSARVFFQNTLASGG